MLGVQIDLFLLLLCSAIRYNPSAMLHSHARVNLLMIDNFWKKGPGTHFTCEYSSLQVLQKCSWTKWVYAPLLNNDSIMRKSTHACKCDVALGLYHNSQSYCHIRLKFCHSSLVDYKYSINWNLKNVRLCWVFADPVTYAYITVGIL